MYIVDRWRGRSISIIVHACIAVTATCIASIIIGILLTVVLAVLYMLKPGWFIDAVAG